MRELLGRSQRVLPQSQNISTGGEVPVYHQSATGAGRDAVSKGELLPMSTARALLTRVRGVHRHIAPTGPCCLVGEIGSELRPRRVSEALGQALVMHHPVDRQILNRDQINGVHEATAVLKCEVAPSPGGGLMDPCYDRAPRFSLRCFLLGRRQTSLRFGKCPFLLA